MYICSLRFATYYTTDAKGRIYFKDNSSAMDWDTFAPGSTQNVLFLCNHDCKIENYNISHTCNSNIKSCQHKTYTINQMSVPDSAAFLQYYFSDSRKEQP